ncbi:hypothetical protein VNO77_02623 [Canavalia gladiata]|uniref:Uncharacterized protein n=1 Tax=Canavalia gladiata TaxID=3824 RepID=A0AAN9MU38_CANGL
MHINKGEKRELDRIIEQDRWVQSLVLDPLKVHYTKHTDLDRGFRKIGDLFLQILREQAVARLMSLGKVSDACGYLERTFWSFASLRAINVIRNEMEDAGLRMWMDQMGKCTRDSLCNISFESSARQRKTAKAKADPQDEEGPIIVLLAKLCSQGQEPKVLVQANNIPERLTALHMHDDCREQVAPSSKTKRYGSRSSVLHEDVQCCFHIGVAKNNGPPPSQVKPLNWDGSNPPSVR